VHIHFARDLIPVAAAIICVIKRKRYVLQTHGMISNQETKFQFFFDNLISRSLLKKAEIVFCLSANELKMLDRFKLSNAQILQNGINIPRGLDLVRQDTTIRVIFLSRIEKRKNLRCFIEVASLSQEFQLNYSFEIYGPDEGDLAENLELIEKLGLSNIQYCGGIRFDEVPTKLSEHDILILPSFDEPWAMVVLEALSVGTRVIIFPSAGVAPFIRLSYPDFISDAENSFSVFQSLVRMDEQTSDLMRLEIKAFCAEHLSISAVVSDYLQMLKMFPQVGS
jgi:glycosyltransferase involved in cell wall biosynthesis